RAPHSPQEPITVVPDDRPRPSQSAGPLEAGPARHQGRVTPGARRRAVLPAPQPVLRDQRCLGHGGPGRLASVGCGQPLRWCVLRQDARRLLPVPGAVPLSNPGSGGLVATEAGPVGAGPRDALFSDVLALVLKSCAGLDTFSEPPYLHGRVLKTHALYVTYPATRPARFTLEAKVVGTALDRGNETSQTNALGRAGS